MFGRVLKGARAKVVDRMFVDFVGLRTQQAHVEQLLVTVTLPAQLNID
jgi:hypothetical protein